MFKLSILLGVLALALTVWCLVEAIAAPESRVRRLRKPLWIVGILLLPVIGPIAWLVMGRPSLAVERAAAAADFAEFERPGRLDPARPDDPVKDEAYREMLRRRAEEQRRRYQQQPKKPDNPLPE
ncbi:MAG: hypothetical protein JWN68_812 [Nocardioides sp.]|uniref:PLD nuclease N-terminal domain-containing protein n=1 Tax=Nocardioides sp. TaxID=35761 RepID=UPI0026116919|nr:PLD nuclease N-terminal domain-containing protein [Nocardioides sp.]MCW2832859.1 hypothetical protein [Nocardioides sp.]